MKLVVVSPEGEDPREQRVVGQLIAAGLESYHLRKPGWSSEQVRRWLDAFSAAERARMIVHRFAELVGPEGLAGCHWPDEASRPVSPSPAIGCASTACHSAEALPGLLGRYDRVLVSPVFASLTKPGYGPKDRAWLQVLPRLLALRAVEAQGTEVFGLGGITAERIAECAACGLDGVAVMGAIWLASDPLAAFRRLQTAAEAAGAGRGLFR